MLSIYSSLGPYSQWLQFSVGSISITSQSSLLWGVLLMFFLIPELTCLAFLFDNALLHLACYCHWCACSCCFWFYYTSCVLCMLPYILPQFHPFPCLGICFFLFVFCFYNECSPVAYCHWVTDVSLWSLSHACTLLKYFISPVIEVFVLLYLSYIFTFLNIAPLC